MRQLSGFLCLLVWVTGCTDKSGDAVDEQGDGGTDDDGTGVDDCELWSQQTELDDFEFLSTDGEHVHASGYAIVAHAHDGVVDDLVDFGHVGGPVASLDGVVYVVVWDWLAIYDRTWTSHPAPATLLNGLWAELPNQVWAVGEYQCDRGECTSSDPVLARFDGEAWTEIPVDMPDGLLDIWGDELGDMVIVGRQGAVARRMDDEFVRMDLPVIADVHEIRGNAIDDLWALASDDTVWHYNGNQWTEVAATLPVDRHPVALQPRDDGDVYLLASSAQYDGGSAEASSGLLLHSPGPGMPFGLLDTEIVGSPSDLSADADALWIGGSVGGPDLARLAIQAPGVVGPSTSMFRREALGGLFATHALSSTNAWALSDRGVVEFDGSWRLVFPLGFEPSGLWMASAGEGFVVGQEILHLVGDELVSMAFPDPQNISLSSVWGRAADDVWAAGEERLLHFDGTEWTEATPPPSPVMELGGDSTGLFATTWTGLFRFEDDAWTQVPTQKDTHLGDLDVDAAGDVWLIVDNAVHRVEGDAAVPVGGVPPGQWFGVNSDGDTVVVAGRAGTDEQHSAVIALIDGSWTFVYESGAPVPVDDVAGVGDTIFFSSVGTAYRLGCVVDG